MQSHNERLVDFSQPKRSAFSWVSVSWWYAIEKQMRSSISMHSLWPPYAILQAFLTLKNRDFKPAKWIASLHCFANVPLCYAWPLLCHQSDGWPVRRLPSESLCFFQGGLLVSGLSPTLSLLCPLIWSSMQFIIKIYIPLGQYQKLSLPSLLQPSNGVSNS